MESMQRLNFTNSSPASYPDKEYENKIFHLKKILIIMCFSITFVLGTVGNGLVIWITGFRMKKTVNAIWFLNLSIADFSFCLFIPLNILYLALDYHWPLGQILCKVTGTSLHLNMAVSVFFLMTISVDRCISVLCPVWSKNHRSVKLARNISMIIWLLCLALNSPYVAFYDIEHKPNSNITYCIDTYAARKNTTFFDHQTRHHRRKVMYVTRFISMFLIPFPVILVCYGLIAFWIRKSSNRLGSRRTFKIIVTVVLCFFCCSFLFYLWPLLKFMGFDLNRIFDAIMHNAALCLIYFNCCLNPIIYVFVGREFKRSLRKSIPFLLESAFREKSDPLQAHDNSAVGNELMPCHA
ncbi:N-formyl peptide receptor 2-like [Xenopus laevis]|uniref:N-formyl peptide receptor 2-like n=2 Tax=Xenopus laevis TaxID=8355 RepID=A0A8J1LCH7_XENLA|nr:N-formyl peptide receptor 2-like [Xenopus laevis]